MKIETRECQVGIYNNCQWVARIYSDKVIVTEPYVKWIGNTGGYAERKHKLGAEWVNKFLKNADQAWQDLIMGL